MSQTTSTSKRRRPLTLFLATALAGGALAAGSLTASASAAQVQPQATALGKKVVDVAKKEATNNVRNREAAKNCNFYSGYWKTSGDNICSKTTGGVKWRSNNWCADFARYTWKNAGAKTKGLDPWAGSFYRAAKTHGTGTWHARGSYVPQPGDAVIYDWDGGTPSLGNNGWDIDHVGIVVSYNKSTKKLTTIEGNTTKTAGGTGTEGTYQRTRSNTASGDVVGYITPKKA